MTLRWLSFGLLALAGCSNGQPNPVGMAEPFRVRNAQFFEGALPGLPPDGGMYVEGGPPRVTDMSAAGGYVVNGSAGKKLPGHVSHNSYSVGFGLPGQGTGWWMISADEPDPLFTPPRLNFTGVLDFSNELKPGPLTVYVVPLTREGEAGVQFREPLCISSTGPEANADCSTTVLPPAAAITLTWDTQVDLDLRVVAPDGRIVSSKHPMLHAPAKGPPDLNLPHIDRDSNANCVVDGFRSESLVWPTVSPDDGETELPEGLYQIYVNLFDPCGQQAVRFQLKITQAVEAESGEAGAGGEPDLVQQVLFQRAGELVATQVSPTAQTGMFITEFTF